MVLLQVAIEQAAGQPNQFPQGDFKNPGASQLADAVLPAGTAATAGAPAGDARARSQQIQQQFKQSLDAAMQPRPLPDDN